MSLKRTLAVVLAGGILVSAAWAAELTADPNFKAKCALCHGANAEGKPGIKIGPLKNAAGKSEAELTARIEGGAAVGTVKMPAFKDKLTPDQIKALVSAIKALK